MSGRRDELVERALGYFLEHGVAALSLRPLAEAVGTSARMLVYHFGSKEGLVTAVMDELQARIRRSFAELASAAAGRRRGGEMRAFWAWLVEPERAAYLRLLFEVQALAMRDPARYGRYLEGTSSGWLDLIEASLPPSRSRRALATLCAAVIDGLLLEYLATGDARRTGEAVALFGRLLKGGLAGASGSAGGSPRRQTMEASDGR